VTAHTLANREKKRLYMAEYYRRHPEKFRTSAKAHYEANKNKPEFKDRQRTAARNWSRRNRAMATEKHRRYAQTHKSLLAHRAKAKREKLRKECLHAYGHACACCGECQAEFLAIDHTNGDGAAHRREIGNQGGTIYGWLKSHGFPQDRFRCLCHNCNLARAFYGYCPHERERVTNQHS
jgi:hypothetical protein